MRPTVLQATQFLDGKDAPPLPSLPTGTPLLFWRLPGFPSVNEVLYLSPKARAEIMRDERGRGYATAIKYAEGLRLPLNYQPWKGKQTLRLKVPLTVAPLFCFVSIIRGDRKQRDIYNLAVKSYIDGCTDAGLWVDDSEDYHKDFWVHFESRGLAHAAEIRFYEEG
jgi:Holliday junction resolvase RusA-like endonuclease